MADAFQWHAVHQALVLANHLAVPDHTVPPAQVQALVLASIMCGKERVQIGRTARETFRGNQLLCLVQAGCE